MKVTFDVSHWLMSLLKDAAPEKTADMVVTDDVSQPPMG